MGQKGASSWNLGLDCCLERSPQLCPNLLVECSPPKEHPGPAPRLRLHTGSMVKQARSQSKELPSFFNWW